VTLVSLHAPSFDESQNHALASLHNKANRQSLMLGVWSGGGNLNSRT